MYWPLTMVVLAAAALSSSPSAAIAAEVSAPGWVADPSSGCRVWNPNPQENETVLWSGGCRDGLAEGRGMLQWFHDGRPTMRYEGEFRAGKENGHGILTKQDGRYEGEFRDGRAYGVGHVEGPGYSYTGVWTDGCFREQDVIIGIGRDPSSCR